MEYSKIISVTGMPGLFELVSSKNDGAIVRSLDDKSTKFISSRIHNFSHLESIEVYTTGDNVNLAEVFEVMKASKDKTPDEKDPVAMKKYFEKVFPTIDFTRVYNNDMRKMIRWFVILNENEVEIKVPEEVEELEEAETEAEATVEEVAEKKPAKKAAAPKVAATTATTAKTVKEPAKKAAPAAAKKASKAKEEPAPKKKAAPAKKKK